MAQGQGAYPAARCKVVYLVRHGQATHNKARLESPNDSVYESEAYFDAPLTELGWRQAQQVREHICNTGSIQPQLVVTSPLSRCIQTAVGIFGSGNSLGPGESNSNALMQNSVASHGLGISSLGCPRFVAVEWCRERMGQHPCDRRRTICKLQDQYPAVDFSEIVHDVDVHYKPTQRETEEEVRYRAQVFTNWLMNLSETRIAVVAHSGFIWEFTRLFGDDLSETVKSELQLGYANCELRAIMLVDKLGLAQAIFPADFPGCSAKYFPG